MLDYFRQVALFDSALALFLILAVNWAFTLVHILQEWKGAEVPLWRVFGAVVGTFVPNRLGFFAFTVFLCAAHWLVGAMAIAGWPMFPGHPWWSIWALGALVGARIADSVVSHWLLYGLGYRPNPGLPSTVLYAIEAIFILTVFHKGYLLNPDAWWKGFASGAIFFIAVLPGLWLLRWAVPAWRRDPWVRGEPIPAWARD
ncbi:MAG: hypothetical protein E6G97_16695 [Alphaproteobacteria bacterium]|nr:MAG: hypothetical protein E6G97_16695 [Alphaproteobacteria bacterium]